MAYAETTKVPIAQTRADIEKILRRAQAQRVITIDEPLQAIVMFMLTARLVKVEIEIRGDASDQVRRSRWRALFLVVKAKIEAVESGITTVEQEWLAHIVLPDGQTMSQWAEPALRIAYDQGQMPDDPLRLTPPKERP